MTLTSAIKSLSKWDLSDLDFENFGDWPTAFKVIAAVLLFVIIATAGYCYRIEKLQTQLASSKTLEVKLRQDFGKKAIETAGFNAHKRQLVEIEENFGALINRLPRKAEVPNLLEDITKEGETNGLNINTINLLDEIPKEFYIELPIHIKAVGSYHNFGAFISGMASLPRIITLHDFDIKSVGDETNLLQMNILAKTYRYRNNTKNGSS